MVKKKKERGLPLYLLYLQPSKVSVSNPRLFGFPSQSCACIEIPVKGGKVQILCVIKATGSVDSPGSVFLLIVSFNTLHL